MKYCRIILSIIYLLITNIVIVHAATDAEVSEENPYIVLRYFESRGRAESIRLLLEYLQLPYEDVRYTKEQWPTFKKGGIESGKFAFGQLPSLTFCPDGNHKSPHCLDMVQSHTILRFLDRFYGTYGPDEKKWLVDMVADGAEDMRSKYTKLVYNENAKELLDDYLENTLPTWLEHFERLKELHAKDEVFFSSNDPTHADLFLYNVLDINVRLSAACLDDYPRLKLFKEVVEAIPSIADYITSERRPKHSNGNSAFLDNPKNPVDSDDDAEKNEKKEL
jgi:glutathione S-transferase